MSASDKKQFYREVDGLVYRTATPADTEALWQLMVTQFYPRTPLCPHLQMNQEADFDFDKDLLPDIMKEGVSLVAEDSVTKQLIGARLSSIELQENAHLKHPLVSDPAIAAKYPKYSVIFRMFDEVASKTNVFERYNVSKALGFMFLVVRESHATRGIAKKLAQFSLEVAKNFNLTMVTALTAGRFSERIYESLGFEKVNVVHVADFVDPVTGGKPFATLKKEILTDSVLYAPRV